MGQVVLTAEFTPDENGMIVNSAGNRTTVVDEYIDDRFFLSNLTDDDLSNDGSFPAYDSSYSYGVTVTKGKVVVTIYVDYDEDSPWEDEEEL